MQQARLPCLSRSLTPQELSSTILTWPTQATPTQSHALSREKRNCPEAFTKFLPILLVWCRKSTIPVFPHHNGVQPGWNHTSIPSSRLCQWTPLQEFLQEATNSPEPLLRCDPKALTDSLNLIDPWFSPTPRALHSLPHQFDPAPLAEPSPSTSNLILADPKDYFCPASWPSLHVPDYVLWTCPWICDFWPHTRLTAISVSLLPSCFGLNSTLKTFFSKLQSPDIQSGPTHWQRLCSLGENSKPVVL